jgi:imidazolonepropionase-like amidohydrolase
MTSTISRRKFIKLATMTGLLAGCRPLEKLVTPIATYPPPTATLILPTSTPTTAPTATPTSAPTATSLPRRPEFIVNGTVIDGTGATPISHGVVALRGNRIAAVGPASAFSIRPDAVVVDAGGGAILPGILDVHVHNTAHASERKVFLEQGVTTVADMGSPIGLIPLFKEENYYTGPAARGLCAGQTISVPGGYGGRYIYSPAQARELVDDLAARGVNHIKLGLDPGPDSDRPNPMPSLEEIRAVVEQAHKHSLMVHAHLLNENALDLALDGGIDVVQHIPSPARNAATEASVVEKKDYFIRRAAAQHARIVKRGIPIVPTLEVFLDGWFEKPDRTPYEQARIDLLLGLVRQFHQMGGVIALGNDSPVPLVQPGMPILEMKMLLAAGLTPMQVLEAGTRHSAAVCGQSQTRGTLEPGKLADVIIVDGDPLTDIQALRRLKAVIKDGQIAYTFNAERME